MAGELSFSQWLTRLRKSRDLTRAELAGQLGYSLETVHSVEGRGRPPSREFVGRLAELLQLAPERRPLFVRWARGALAADEASRLRPLLDELAPRRPSRHRAALPAPPTRLIGRARDVAAAKERLLHPGVRLLTLLGPPGIGKTRLGLQVAAEALDAFADGVSFVPLASIRDPGLVATTVARRLGISEANGRSVADHVAAALRERQVLLVLDNFEHLLRAATLVAELLAAAPDLKVLVTSREVLRLYGEHEFPVPPLALPALCPLPAPEVLARVPAVALFVERAAAVWPGFALTEANAPAVAGICHCLDGLPLAIELAAARSKLFSPQTLLERLTSRLDMLRSCQRIT